MARNLRRGNRGTDVAQLQADLNRYLSPNPPLVVDGDFGRGTDAAVRAFQRREGLSADGVVGPNTFRALQGNAANTGGSTNYNDGPTGSAPVAGNEAGGGTGIPVIDTGPDLTPLRTTGLTSMMAEAAVQSALTQIHVREVGDNGGPDVEKYCRSAGKSGGVAWCMAFVYWCYSEAAGRVAEPHPMLGVPDWAKIYVTGVYAWAQSAGKTVDDPVRGDVFCVRGGSGDRTHRHTGIVTDVSGGSINTIEGNTNNDGSSNGIGVFTLTRSTGRLDFFRLP